MGDRVRPCCECTRSINTDEENFVFTPDGVLCTGCRHLPEERRESARKRLMGEHEIKFNTVEDLFKILDDLER